MTFLAAVFLAAVPLPEPNATESVVLLQVYRSRFDWGLPWKQELPPAR